MENNDHKQMKKKPKLWKNIRSRVQVMAGSMAQSNLKFGHGSRNKQGASNAVVAPVYANIKNPVEWINDDVDNILRTGDELYRTTIFQMKIKMGSIFSPNCVYPVFYVLFHKVTIFIGNDVVTGELVSQPESQEDFIKNLTELLKSNDGLILKFNDIYFSLWISGNSYYCFCPHSGNSIGLFEENLHGTSFVLRSSNVEELNEFFTDIHSGPYSLYSIKILKKSKVEKTISKILLREQQRRNNIEKPEELVEETSEVEEKESEPKTVELVKGKQNEKEAIDAKRNKGKNVPKSDDGSKKPADTIPEFQELPLFQAAFSNDYKAISPSRGILCANSYVKEPERILHTNIAAVIYLSSFRSCMWTKETLNDILKLGKTIFEVSSENDVIENENWQERIFYPIEFMKKRYKIHFEKIVFGEVVARDSDITCELKKGLNDFFQRYDVGLINGPQNVIIWQEAGLYFMFDAKERDQMGRKWTRLLSSALGDIKNSGGACVTWYRDINQLSEIYIGNVQLKHRRDAYRIIKVDVVEDLDREIDINNWKAMDLNKWRLVAEINLCDKAGNNEIARVFKAMCVALIGTIMPKVLSVEEWQPQTLEEIIDKGIEHYKDSLNITEDEYGEEDQDVPNPDFQFNDVKKTTTIQGERVSILIEECIYKGRILNKSEDDENKNFKSAVETFFQYYTNGIVKVGDIYMAIWYHENFYYMFYPYEKSFGFNNSCLCKENDSELYGYAFALRFKDTSSFTKDFLNIININENEEYCITNVFATIYKADEKPPLFKYLNFTENGAILRPFKSDFHEGHPSFVIRGDKQTEVNVLVALGLARINRSAMWNKEDLVDILKIGDRIYCNLTNHLDDCGIKDYKIQWDDINLVIGSNKFSISRGELSGMFEHPQKGLDIFYGEGGEEVFLEEEDNLADDLKTILTPWEKSDQEFGILESDFFKVALWKQDELYFIFDPKASNDQGYPSERRIKIAIDIITERKRAELMEYEGEEEEEENNGNNLNEAPQKINYKEIPNDGSAYVAWFYKFESFLEHILSKVPPEYRQEGFIFHSVTISNSWNTENEISTENRHSFNSVSDGHMIMRASTSQNELMFPNRFKQEASNAVVALAFALISTCDRWNSTILDIILKYGDRLYTKSLNLLKQEDLRTACLAEKLSIEHIVASFSIYKIRFEFKIISTSFGGLSSSDYKEVRKSLAKIGTIEANNGAVLKIKGHINVMWKSGNSVYLFDSTETDPSGYISKTGFASLAKFNGMNGFLEFLIKKFGCIKEPNTFESHIIEIVHVLPTNLVSYSLANIDQLPKLTEGQVMFVPIELNMRMLTGLIREHKIPVSLLCLATLIHSRLHYVELWVENVFEQILFLAQYLLGKTKCELDKIKDVITVDLEEMIPNFTIDNILVHVNIRNMLQGPLTHSEDSNSIDLDAAVKIYFRECTHSIITINDVSFALWRESGFFYIFQDLSKIIKRGKIIASSSLDNIINIMKSDFDLSNKFNWYEIKNCKITTIPIKETCRMGKIAKPASSQAAVNEERLCGKEANTNIKDYCDECYYWDYITKKAKKSNLRKPKTNKEYKTISEGIDVLSGKTLVEKHKLFSDKEKYLTSLKAACIVAAAMTCIKKPSDWTSKTIDLISSSGTILYIDTVAVKGITQLNITDFEELFYLCNKRLLVKACPAEKFLIDDNFVSILSNYRKQHNLLYFMLTKPGEVEGALYLTLILEECYSYIFFPGGVGHCTEEMESEKETPCLLRFKDIIDMCKQLEVIAKCYVPVMFMGPIVACLK